MQFFLHFVAIKGPDLESLSPETYSFQPRCKWWRVEARVRQALRETRNLLLAERVLIM